MRSPYYHEIIKKIMGKTQIKFGRNAALKDKRIKQAKLR